MSSRTKDDHFCPSCQRWHGLPYCDPMLAACDECEGTQEHNNGCSQIDPGDLACRSSKTDLEFVLTALRHALGGMRAVQEHAPQGTAAARYANELEQAIGIVERMRQDETKAEPTAKDEVLESFRLCMPIGRPLGVECPNVEVKVPLRWLAIAAAEIAGLKHELNAASSPEEPTVPNAHCNGCGQDYVATKGHVCPAVKASGERCKHGNAAASCGRCLDSL